MKRPTYRELDKKIADAKTAVSLGLVNLVNPEAMAADAAELGYSIEDQFIPILMSLLENTTPEDYAGRRPPAKSYQNIILSNPLYAFRTRAKLFESLIYFKFSLYEEELWVVSLHKNRNHKTGRE